MRVVATVARRMNRACEIGAGLLLIGVLALNLAQVLFRYALASPLSWTEEIMRYSMIWLAFLAGSAAVYRREHIAPGLLSDLRSPALARTVEVAVLLAIGCFALLLATNGLSAAFANATQLSPAARLPMIYPYLAVGVGGVLMLINVACMLVLGSARAEGRGDALAPEEVA